MTNINNFLVNSRFAGLGNTSLVEGSQSYASLSLPAFGISSTRVEFDVPTDQTLNRVQFKLTGLESEWRTLDAQFEYYNATTFGAATELIVLNPYYTTNKVGISVSRINQTGGTRTMTAFTLGIKIRIMTAPF